MNSPTEGRGRPPKSEADRRSKVVKAFFTPAERAKLQELCEAHDLPIAELIRRAVLNQPLRVQKKEKSA